MAFYRLQKLTDRTRYPYLPAVDILQYWDLESCTAYDQPPSHFVQQIVDKILVIVHGRVFHESADAYIGKEDGELVVYIDRNVYEGLF